MAGTMSSKRPTVLVVEDNEDERYLVSTMFKGSDLDVIECGNAEAASEILDKNSDEIALVFADIRLGGKMDGVDLAQTVSRKFPAVRVIVTSGNPGERLKELPDNAEFLQKPWLGVDLLSKAEELRAAA